MKRREMRALEARGFTRRVHERNLDYPFSRRMPQISRLPSVTVLNGYAIHFTEELWGGFKVDITNGSHRKVAGEVRIKRWSWTDVKDPHTGNRLELSLSILSPHSLKMTVFEKRDR